MDEKYFAEKIEEKWQKKWAESGTFEAEIDTSKPKFYQLEMLPYPSGNLHMGHVRNYSIGDALAWYKRLKGFNVLHPIGWDSFGQPAEDAAIKRGANPRTWTEENIKYMTAQLKRLGLSYDWRRQMAAHRPEYYKFDQWFFLKMYEMGLAYKKLSQVNWCPNEKTTLSNEQASGGLCWRCGWAVEKKDLEQWFLRTTNYADQLLDDMAEIEAGWAEKVLKRQRDWIGRSEGTFVDFGIGNADFGLEGEENPKSQIPNPKSVRVFTTRIDTIYGANAIVVAAEHPIIEANFESLVDETKTIIEKIKADKLKVVDRDVELEKEGVDTGLKAINPISNEELPIWVGNYVMMEYGTGAVMSVPAHDERDFEFAKKYNLPIRKVINQTSPNFFAELKDTGGIEFNEAILSEVMKLLTVLENAANEITQMLTDLENYPADQTIDFAKKIVSFEPRYAELMENYYFSSNQIDFLLYQFDTTIFEGKENRINEIIKKLGKNRENSEKAKNRFDNLVKRAKSITKNSDLPVSQSVKEAMTEYGILVNSGEWSGESSKYAKQKMTEYAEKHNFGEATTTYRLRDWGISRQRFWGAPIPIVYCKTCGTVPEKYENLPVELPETAPFTGVGESPLAKVPEFVNTTCPNCGEPAERETDTMDTFVDSSWYFFRYTDSHNEILPFSPEVANYWTPVDQYVGGDDHAVMHLIYTRFWTKVMRDMELVNFNEPVKRLLTQGMVIGETFFDDETGKKIYFPPNTVTVKRDAKGKIISAENIEGKKLKTAVERMSKSKGNGVDPNEMIEIYGADAARMFVLFAAPAENELVWNESGIEGTLRFLQRVWRFVWKWQGKITNYELRITGGEFSAEAKKLRRKTHQTIKRIEENLEFLQFNTPVAALMELSNAIHDFKVEPETASESDIYAIREAVESLVLMLTPYAPHTAEEIYSVLVGNDEGILANGGSFPEYREDLAKSDEIEIPIQINGKLRSRVLASAESTNEELEKMALADEKVREQTDGKQIIKVIVVPKRLVNIVVKG